MKKLLIGLTALMVVIMLSSKAQAQLTQGGGHIVAVDDVDEVNPAVPEPASMFLLASGLMGVAIVRNKRSKR